MSGITDFDVVVQKTGPDFANAMAAKLAAGWQPYQGTQYIHEHGIVVQPIFKGAQILVGATGAVGATGTTGPTGPTGPTGASQVFYGETADAANTYTCTIAGATLVAGYLYSIKFDHAPDNAATLSLNGSPAKAIVTATGAAIAAPQGIDGQIALLLYDGVRFVYVVQPNQA